MLSLHGTSQDSFYKFQWFGSVGQALPLGDFSADNSSSNAMETGKSKPFAQSYRIGFDFYPFKHLGITAGSSIVNFSFDKRTLERMHSFNESQTESYHKNNFTNNRIQVGITSRFTLMGFSAEPRISIGIVTPVWVDAEVYFKTSEGEIYRTYSYSFITPKNSEGFWACYNGAINLNYNILQKKDGMAIALLFFSEFTFYNPKVSLETIVSDSHTDTITHTEDTFRQPFTYFYYGFGIILKHGWFTPNED